MWLLLLIGHLYLSGMWFRAVPRMDVTDTCFTGNKVACSKYDNYFKFNSQHNSGKGGLYDHLMSTRIITLIMNKFFM